MNRSIAALENHIRSRINAGRKRHELLGRTADWNRLCSALDVTGDTELALDSYLKHAHVEDTGIKYLHIYGALQLLQTQQEAAAEICSALQIKPQSSPKVPLIRELRSSAIGHPTRQREDHREKSNFIVRITLTQFSFTLFTVAANEASHTERHVDIPNLIELQRTTLAATLQEVIKLLDEVEMNHREQHRDEKLVACFPDTLPYYFSKIFEALHSPRSSPDGKMHIDLIVECLAKMRAMLEKRGEWNIYDSIDYEYKLLEYPLHQLAAFFTEPSSGGLNEKDAYIFCSFISEQIKTLIKIAEELDEKYATDSSNNV
jgi:AAA+ ATPase superfamily predicted ATPase